MDAIKHTPWKIGLPHPQNACAYVVDSEGNDVAALYGGDDDAICTNGIWSEQPIRDAHARLIAAAPDLQNACSKAFDFLGGVEGAAEIRDVLLTALQKAEGRS